jgi:16S rRNA (guanine966-N2)-methyltransferase
MDSKLQIISGKYRGRKLRLPPQARPTQNRARIALFNMLESGILNTNDKFIVWDAFAGSGAFGLECISRYQNADVIFTDVSPTSLKTVRDNVATLGEHATIKQADAINSINDFGKNADLIFLDPPYADSNLGGVFVHKLGKIAPVGTILIWEQEVGHEAEPDTTKWQILRDKRYGRASFLILQKI